MKPRYALGTFLLVVLGVTTAHARYVEALLKDKVAASRVIAAVQVTEELSDNPPGRYRRVARVEVQNAIKGARAGDLLTIDYDSDFPCDDVRYAVGEQCLVFLYEQPNGRLATYNYAYGKYRVSGDVVQRWTVKRFSHRDSRMEHAVTMIKAALAGRKTGA